jgi:HlyD family secretion protein
MLGLLLLAGGGIGLRWWLAPTQSSVLQLSGRIEADDTQISAKVGGRLHQITVQEGDVVHQGQVLAELDDAELEAQLQAAQAQLAAARQGADQAQLQLQVIDSQRQEAQLTLQQSQGDAAGRVDQAAATAAASRALLLQATAQRQQAEVQLQLARTEQQRYAGLLRSGAIAQQQFDQIDSQYQTAQETLQAQQAVVTAAERQVAAAKGSLAQAQTSQLNPDIQFVQLARLQTQRAQAAAQLSAAQAEVRRVQAVQAEIMAQLQDLVLVSPIDGVVVTSTAEPGEVIAAGTPVITLVNLNRVYLRGYVSEGDLGRVRVGQAARVFLDSAPEQPLAATVTAIDTEASFTPENIYFRDDRVTQVFGVKLNLINPDGFAKPGMPADGEILWETP